MVTPTNVSLLNWYTQNFSPSKNGFFPHTNSDISSLTKAITLTLSTPGRISFYEDYSERSTAGTHTFRLQRTHGSSGVVSVIYESFGDAHTNVMGMVHWNDGDLGIKEFTVDVPTKTVGGDHRIYVKLTHVFGGAVLHNGEFTLAYGIIDDGTIAPDSDAVFYDSAAVGPGTGTQADPYNNIYTAKAALGSKRYFYGKGTTTPDTTEQTDGPINVIKWDIERTSEETRLVVRAWPGFTWTILGDAGVTETAGFLIRYLGAYQTYRKINFQDLKHYGIFYYNLATAKYLTIEHCNTDNIIGDPGNNVAAYLLWIIDGYKLWRCTASNIKIGASPANNCAGMQTYSGTNGSVQRCYFTTCYDGMYHKRAEGVGTVSTSCSFNHFDVERYGAFYGAAGSTGHGHKYAIVRSNLFKGCNVEHILGGGVPATEAEQALYIVNNVFDGAATGDSTGIGEGRALGSIFFNNIMLNCDRVWTDDLDYSSVGETIVYADYNHEFGTVLTASRYKYRGVAYATAAALNAAFGYAANDVISDPLFTNPATNDYTLQVGSPAIGTGVSGTDKGIYLTGIEVIGA